MKNSEDISLLSEHLSYCKDTGIITWIKSTSCAINPGDRAGTLDSKGYISLYFKNKKFKAHRVAFALTYGRWPNLIDHVNGIKTDNRISNLRECTHNENMQNSRVYLRKGKSSKFTGVSRISSEETPWTAQIRINSKKIHLGRFSSEIEAHHAYLAAKAELHKFQPTPREAQV